MANIQEIYIQALLAQASYADLSNRVVATYLK